MNNFFLVFFEKNNFYNSPFIQRKIDFLYYDFVKTKKTL